jgi:glucose-6-phosphate 1-epimerase
VSRLQIDDTARGHRVTCGHQTIEVGRNGSLTGWSWDGREMIYASPLSIPGRRLRGGMPVCWPWFGAPPAEGLPPHGFLLDSVLDVGTPRIAAERIEVTLTGRIADQPGFSGTARVTVAYALEMQRPRLAATVTVENPSARPIGYAVGFHPYLALPELHGAPCVIADGQRIEVPAMIDRKFACAGERIEVREGERPLWLIRAQGMSTLGIWKIDAARAATIADLPNDAHERFICVNPIAFGQSLPAGASRSHAMTLQPSAEICG